MRVATVSEDGLVTTWSVLGSLARLWFVGVYWLLALVVLLLWLAARPGLYEAQADVHFLAPESIDNPNALQNTTAGLIATAGLVEREVANTISGPATAASVTLSGRGVRSGTSIRLPNSGGQWGRDFRHPWLDVQAVGPSEEETLGRLNQRIEDIEVTLERIQVTAGVPVERRITTTLSPERTTVAYQSGSRQRALAAVAMIGLGLGCMMVTLLDRYILRRRLRHGLPLAPVTHREVMALRADRVKRLRSGRVHP